LSRGGQEKVFSEWRPLDGTHVNRKEKRDSSLRFALFGMTAKGKGKRTDLKVARYED
jgi:hypothetical protein